MSFCDVRLPVMKIVSGVVVGIDLLKLSPIRRGNFKVDDAIILPTYVWKEIHRMMVMFGCH